MAIRGNRAGPMAQRRCEVPPTLIDRRRPRCAGHDSDAAARVTRRRLTLLPLVALLGGPVAGAQERVAIAGHVFDSLGGRPLAGATVQVTGVAGGVVGRSASAATDQDGRFVIRDLLPGRYVAGFYHDVLDSLGIEDAPLAVDAAGARVDVTLATPSARTMIRTICGPAAVSDSVGLLLGHVYAAGTRSALAGAVVTVEWGETLIGRGTFSQRNVGASVTTHRSGWFAACEVPGDIELTVSAAAGADSSGFIPVEVPRSGVRHVTLTVGGARRVPSVSVDTITPIDTALALPAPEMAWRGDAVLTGVVRGERGQPVGGARVFVRGTNRFATTSDRGYFALDSLPGGTHVLEVRALGYLPSTEITHLAAERAAQAEVFIGDRAVTLEAVRVQATLVFSRNLARFQANRERNPGGAFIGPREIERFRGMRFSNLLQGIPGVRLSYAGGFAILMDFAGADDDSTRTSRGLCVPMFYVDGARSQYTAAELEGLYRADEIAGVEVYVRENQRPVEFQDSGSRCGAIAIWTRPELRRRPAGGPPPA